MRHAVRRPDPRLACATVLVLASGCGAGGGDDGRGVARAENLLLISIDTLRRDHVSTYGYERETTPAIDALAAEGVVFEDALSTSNWTLPAHVSLFTGLPTAVHGVQDEDTRLSERFATLWTVLADAGFRTGAFTSHVYTDARYGYTQGGDGWETQPNRNAKATSDLALEWLDAAPTGRFFLFLHYFDPHWNFRPPKRFADLFDSADPVNGQLTTLFPYFSPTNTMPDDVRRDAITLYDAEIASTDFQVGRVVEHLREAGRLDATLVVLVSDHGEEFGEHGTFGHGTHLHAEVTRIPFVARFPARLEPQRKGGGPVWLADVPRFALELLGVDAPEQFAHHSVDLLGEVASGRALVIETTRWGPRRLAMHGDGELLLTGGSYQPLTFNEVDGRMEPELLPAVALAPRAYRRADDPEEQRDLGPDAYERLREAARAWLTVRDGPGGGARLAVPRDPERSTTIRLHATVAWPDEPCFLGAFEGVATKDEHGLAEVVVAPGEGSIELGLRVPRDVRDFDVAIARGDGAETRTTIARDAPLETDLLSYRPPTIDDADGAGAGGVEHSPEELELLRSLGYIE